MKKFCDKCRTDYDDERQSMICDHGAFLSADEWVQKRLAVKLLGKNVRFLNRQFDGPRRVTSVSRTGMITLEDMSGEFAPHLFEIVHGC